MTRCVSDFTEGDHHRADRLVGKGASLAESFSFGTNDPTRPRARAQRSGPHL